MILTDTFIIENAELLIEQRGGKTVRRLRGIFGRCDEKNNNGRVYSKHILEREVKRIAEAMAERRLLGELDHPTHDAVKLSNVSHLITTLDFKGNELVGECELLDTPAGKVAQALVEGGVRVGISSRGMGTLSEHADGSKHVNEDFRLVTFDLVADPSTRGAFPGISESALVEEIVKDTLDKAAKEKVFTTLLKDNLREKLNVGSQSVKPIKNKISKKKPTVEEPFRNWEDFYSYNSRPPYYRKDDRGYEDAETVTEPDEVVENKYATLRDILLENTGSDLVEGKKLAKAALFAALIGGACKGPSCPPKTTPGSSSSQVAQDWGDREQSSPAGTYKGPGDTVQGARQKKTYPSFDDQGGPVAKARNKQTPTKKGGRNIPWGVLGTAAAAAAGGYVGAKRGSKAKPKKGEKAAKIKGVR